MSYKFCYVGYYVSDYVEQPSLANGKQTLDMIEGVCLTNQSKGYDVEYTPKRPPLYVGGILV